MEYRKRRTGRMAALLLAFAMSLALVPGTAMAEGDSSKGGLLSGIVAQENVDLTKALKDGSTLTISATDGTQWQNISADDRDYIGTTEDGAQLAMTIESDKAGWLIFDWSFATSGNWKDKFQYKSTGSTESGNYETIGANSSSYVGKWTTKVEKINAGTTEVTWTYTKGSGSTALIDNIRFVTEQTGVSASSDANTDVKVTKDSDEVTAVDPGSSVKFTATPKDGYVFAGWKLSAEAEDVYSSALAVTETVYDEPVSLYASSEGITLAGQGTEADPYQISTYADLQKFAGYVKANEAFKDKYVKLMADIDADAAEFEGVGLYTSAPFSGTFDGDGHVISNIKLARGLFNYAKEATLKNFTVDGSLVADNNRAGMVAAAFSGTMTDVTAKGTVVSAKESIGGLVGYLESESSMDSCSSDVAMTLTYSGNTQPVAGGLVGEASYSTSVTNCTFTGSIDGTADGEACASVLGGIIGKVGSTTVKGCHVRANIKGKQRIGGIVGSCDSSALDLSECTYEGDVEGITNVGGIIGYLYGGWSSSDSDPKVQSSVAKGTVKATDGVAGGIAGLADRAVILTGCQAMQTSVQATVTAARIAPLGTKTENTRLSENVADRNMLVNGKALALYADTAKADGIDGAPTTVDISGWGEAQLKGFQSDWDYTGEEVKDINASVVLVDETFDNYALIEGTDYTVSFQKEGAEASQYAKDEGAYTMTVAGIGAYEGSFEKAVRILTPAGVVSMQISDLPAADKITAENVDQVDAVLKAYSELSDEQKANISGEVAAKLIAASVAATEVKLSMAANEAAAALVDATNKATAAATPTDLSGAAVTVKGATYNGKAQSPAVMVKLGSKTLAKGIDYQVTYANNKNAGTGVAVVKGVGKYTGAVTKTFSIAKKANPLATKAASKTFKAAKVKKKAQAFKPAVVKAKGVGVTTYAKKSVTAKYKKYVTVASNGKVTLKKGAPKGKCVLVLKVKAAGNANYKALTKTAKVTIAVK